MPRLPVVSGKETVKALNKIGFVVAKQEGSHIKLTRTTELGGRQTVIVPNHKSIKSGTLKNGILKSISLSVEEFIKLLKIFL